MATATTRPSPPTLTLNTNTTTNITPTRTQGPRGGAGAGAGAGPGTSRRPSIPPPPPPKSPLRARARSGSESRGGSPMARRRGDGSVMTLTMPQPLGALQPPTPPAAEHISASAAYNLPSRSTTTTSSSSSSQKQTQTQQQKPQFYPRPVSPLRLQSAKKTEKKEKEKNEKPNLSRRESSLSKIGRRLTRRASSSFRKSGIHRVGAGIANSGISGGVSKESKAKAKGGRQRQSSMMDMARRESMKLRSILKSSSTTLKPIAIESRPPLPLRTSSNWEPPRARLEKRQSSGTNLRSILKPSPAIVVPVPVPAVVKPIVPIIKNSIPRPPSSSSKPELKPQVAVASLPQRNSKDVTLPRQPKVRLSTEPLVIMPKQKPAQVPAQVSSQASSRTGRDGKDILSDIDPKRTSAAEVRRKLREFNKNYFHSRVWDPALQKDLDGAFRLAHGGSEETHETSGQQKQQTQQKNQAQATKRCSWQKRMSASLPIKVAGLGGDEWKRYEGKDVEEWGRGVRLAMAKLEDKITTEARTDPARFMKARRESAQLRAWVASQRRTSDARLSALAMGRVRPNSQFEQAFVAELLRENEIRFKHSSNPMAEAEKMFQNAKSKRSTLIPHYTPFSQYPLLTPLEEIEGEGKAEEEEEEAQHLPRKRLSVFDEKKAARRAGREYKSLSASTQLDQVEIHDARCCGLLKPKAFVDKIP